MKRAFMLLLILSVAFSCNKQQESTMDYIDIMITVTDSNGDVINYQHPEPIIEYALSFEARFYDELNSEDKTRMILKQVVRGNPHFTTSGPFYTGESMKLHYVLHPDAHKIEVKTQFKMSIRYYQSYENRGVIEILAH